MVKKYHHKSDNELVFDYKKTHSDDVELELISRYRNYSKIIAGAIFKKYKFLYQIEFEDIESILLSSLFIAVKKFNDEKLSFYQYWKTTANHEVQNYIRKFTVLNSRDLESSDSPFINGFFKEKNEIHNDEYFSLFELKEVFSNPINKFHEGDYEIFSLYLEGYNITEIASLNSLTYSQVRYRIDYIKNKLANILFNQ